ncbi:NUDIX domain-containing protein [Niveispirillum sp. SYP-B3756]|uniref:NUDIX hydrolase n=1 Tax=Niveispirillum sp. SYP-B3756 TaxID=2662178 RepID=UPI0012915E50|nr:NUDIX domain-containing protein [Niveispirillum sp. SYP-B3756]MQP68035.1 NUDIX domain-containing protein [Niveispirillum sp. SYP-B3756]
MNPRVGCGAFIQDDAGRLLLVKRRRNPEADHWGLPGGKVDFLEKVSDTVVREIAEELGVEIALTGLLCVVDQIDREAPSHWINPVHRARIVAGEPQVMEPDALADWGWFALDALPQPLTVSTRAALEAAVFTQGSWQ